MVRNRFLQRDKAKKAVLSRLVRVEPGAASYLPSERDLARQLGMSRASVRAALAELEKEGRIVREQGRGTRAAPSGEPKVGTVAVVFGSPSDSSDRGGAELAELFALIEGISLALGSRGIPAIFCPASGYASEAMGTGASATSATFAQEIMRRTSAAVLVEWQHALDVAREFDREDFPYIVANEEEGADVRGVRVDFAGVGRQAAEYMARCGYDHAVGLVGSRRRFVFGELCRGFKEGWADRHMEWKECHQSVDAAHQALRSVIEESGRGVAVFAFGDGRTLGALSALKECGLAAPEDAGLMCYGRNGQAVREADVTGFTEPALNVGRTSVEKLAELASRGSTSRTTIVPAPLVQGRTMFF